MQEMQIAAIEQRVRRSIAELDSFVDNLAGQRPTVIRRLKASRDCLAHALVACEEIRTYGHATL